MRVLLDECLPRKLVRELAGHEVITVARLGWAGLRNGDLLGRAAQEFDVFITIDQRLVSQSWRGADLAIITLRARSNRLQDLLPLVPRIMESIENLQPGSVLVVSQN
jgi:hypothetical protein